MLPQPTSLSTNNNNMTRLETLKAIQKDITLYKKKDTGFRILYNHLLSEINILKSENADNSMGTYLFHLEQTLSKQAKWYIDKEHLKTKSIRMKEYKEFIMHFGLDIGHGFSHYRNNV
jgi:hypothetical protein